MRLWSFHPIYLDRLGLLANWREGLLAQNAIQKAKLKNNKTPAYYNHPQLNRFKNSTYCDEYLSFYLLEIWEEGNRRGYKFNASKIACTESPEYRLPVNKGQIIYEFGLLQEKLYDRDRGKYYNNISLTQNNPYKIKSNPVFAILDGGVESWENEKVLSQVPKNS